jgi:hypothetical protein
MKKMLGLALGCTLAACGGGGDTQQKANGGAQAPEKVAASGKTEVPLAELPADVLAAAKAARAGFVPGEAETETREGRPYYDVGGRLPDGSEVEFDIMEEGGRWRVVEVQRDIDLAAAPAPVREAAAGHDARFKPTRVIESDQGDGTIIYELFGPQGTDPQGRKVEIKWEGSRAEVLTKEWAH